MYLSRMNINDHLQNVQTCIFFGKLMLNIFESVPYGLVNHHGFLTNNGGALMSVCRKYNNWRNEALEKVGTSS